MYKTKKIVFTKYNESDLEVTAYSRVGIRAYHDVL